MSLLADLFPRWALRRALARQQLAVLESRRFQTQSTYRKLATDQASADSALAPAIRDLRARSRHLAENHDLYVAILQELVSQVVGTGLYVEPMGVSVTGRPLKRFNETAQRVWEDWTEHPEATGLLSWTESQRKVAWAWFQDGEVFIQHVTAGYPWREGQLRYTYAQVEADYCPVDTYTVGRQLQAGAVQGIEHDQWGRPTRYWFFEEHPGDTLVGRPAPTLKTVAVPAEQITHLKFTRRWPQVRGQPLAHAAFNRLADLADYEQSELIAAKVASNLTAFIQRDVELAGPSVGAIGNAEQRTLQMAPGMVYELLPGETVGSIVPERPNPELTNFRAAQLRAASGGCGVKYSTVARDYIASYSAARQEMVEGEGHYMELRSYFVDHFIRPVYQRVIRAAVLAGRLQLPNTTSFERATRLEIAGPGIPWIDPLKEAQADVLLLNERLASRASILRKRGVDPVKLAMQLEAEDEDEPDDQAPPPAPEVEDDDAQSEADDGDADQVGAAPGSEPGEADRERRLIN